MSRFLDGLLALARAHKTQLAGGDLAEAPVPVADIVLIGAVPRGRALLRSGAKVGDLIYVTGTLGGAATGLKRLEELADGNRRLTDRLLKHNSLNTRLRIALAQHLYPNPRVAQGLWLQRRGLATAAIDLSDGLSTDLAHLCEESGVAAEVEEGLLPVHAGATLDQALSGGEDYELLFTARAGARMPKSIAGVPVKRIGRVVKQRRGRPAITLLTADASRPLEPRGWEHFS
jgi:thiamine-monophosphate kinase